MRRLIAWYDNMITGLAVLAGATVVLMFVLILGDVVLRTAGVSMPGYSGTIVEYALVYMTMMAAPYLVRTRVHVYIDVVVTVLPEGIRRWTERFVYLVAALACLVFMVVALQLFADAIESGRVDVRAINVPLWVSMIPLPVGFTLVAIEFGRFLFGSQSYYTRRGDVRESL